MTIDLNSDVDPSEKEKFVLSCHMYAFDKNASLLPRGIQSDKNRINTLTTLSPS